MEERAREGRESPSTIEAVHGREHCIGGPWIIRFSQRSPSPYLDVWRELVSSDLPLAGISQPALVEAEETVMVGASCSSSPSHCIQDKPENGEALVRLGCPPPEAARQQRPELVNMMSSLTVPSHGRLLGLCAWGQCSPGPSVRAKEVHLSPFQVTEPPNHRPEAELCLPWQVTV